ncbi:hypothetical protein PMAYCL1PPCAC_25343, partial [Pristionchus mayeri]
LLGLTDDCLLDVLTRVDHNDLDAIAILSKRLHNLSNFARSKAVKVKSNKLHLPWLNEFLLNTGSTTLFMSKVETGNEVFKDLRFNEDKRTDKV